MEKIILNGVDVSRCDYIETYKEDEQAVCSCIDTRDCEGDIDLLLTYCKENPQCYYKKLQRINAAYKFKIGAINTTEKQIARKNKQIDELIYDVCKYVTALKKNTRIKCNMCRMRRNCMRSLYKRRRQTK